MSGYESPDAPNPVPNENRTSVWEGMITSATIIVPRSDNHEHELEVLCDLEGVDTSIVLTAPSYDVYLVEIAQVTRIITSGEDEEELVAVKPIISEANHESNVLFGQTFVVPIGALYPCDPETVHLYLLEEIKRLHDFPATHKELIRHIRDLYNELFPPG